MASFFWDTNLFIYLVEDHPQYAAKVNDLLTFCEDRGHSIATSTFTLAELLVAPRKNGNAELSQAFREILQPPTVRLIPFSASAAEHYGEIRASVNVRPADAIQLACAADAAVNVFVTNDNKLIGKKIPGIDFVVGLDVKLL